MAASTSASSSATLTGVLERIIFFNEENHYTIAEFRPDLPPAAAADAKSARPEPVTIVGPLPGVECGETLHLSGEWSRHAQHGAQFKVAAFKSELPSSVYGIRKYLGSGLVPGIGKVYANKIVDALGTETFRVLSEDSGRLRHVAGIGPKRATAIKQAWDEKRIERELYIFLQTYGVTPSQCVKLVGRYGAAAKQILTTEPYRVAREIDGIGFKTADRIAINVGFANDAAPRVDGGILYALETLQEEGHTGFPHDELVAYTANLLETESRFVEARLAALVQNKSLVAHFPAVGGTLAPTPVVGGAPSPRTPVAPLSDVSASPSGTPPADLPAAAFLQLPHNDRAETRIAAAVLRLTRTGSALPAIKIDAAVEWAEKKAGFVFHPLQRLALKNALAHKVTILTGGPGTGKTSILRALVEILKAKKVRVHLAAPTGRAAQRLAETTGGFASTIHRLLKYDAAKGGFVANESAPLATDFLILDEASMLDTRLAASLLQAIPSRAHLLLVGDTDQLPSVGAGNVLKDLIAAAASETVAAHQPSLHITTTRLSVIFRQQGQSQIVTTAHAINDGNPALPPATNDVADAQVFSDLNFIAATDAEDCVRKVLALCTEFVPRKLKWPHPVADVQVLAPMHKGTAGVANLNAQLQAALNPEVGGGSKLAWDRSGPRATLRAGSTAFRPGDKVIQLRNNYDKNLFNGDIGTVTAVHPEKSTLEADFDGDPHTFDRGDLGALALAYAISIHKSQGSEYPVVIIPLLKAHFMMLQRNLIYTAITRGRKKVFIVGEPAAYAMAVRNNESKQRYTHLREKIAAA
ncbi:SF1B family DNA helicase RecD2 [Horticoccus luteus]|uniref:SF1B family DNA helicase RecD2 n=1 Tax=Horticoccus luteus TaxID=2862869 RepID=UPI00210221CF|nr:ATP-dependent RecD-like DNA helicase [Horticoccus luteus]